MDFQRQQPTHQAAAYWSCLEAESAVLSFSHNETHTHTIPEYRVAKITNHKYITDPSQQPCKISFSNTKNSDGTQLQCTWHFCTLSSYILSKSVTQKMFKMFSTSLHSLLVKLSMAYWFEILELVQQLSLNARVEVNTFPNMGSRVIPP